MSGRGAATVAWISLRNAFSINVNTLFSNYLPQSFNIIFHQWKNVINCNANPTQKKLKTYGYLKLVKNSICIYFSDMNNKVIHKRSFRHYKIIACHRQILENIMLMGGRRSQRKHTVWHILYINFRQAQN